MYFVYFPVQSMKQGHWYRNELEINRYYSATWVFLPIGSMFITALIILLMILFNRCPQTIAGFATGVFGIITVFIVILFLDEKPIYI
ncbi:uncharacterized protein LOC122854258 [Aphidius gifuensis]|uniref:uncharacterized protein LOC122854258 n=1 Tax=Aphidius gifuensis TaxID=684658 RepID=UPI001CDD8A6D|nr:uncharacterized protein LOC122854258 [Aphidius gifuensis]